MIVVDYDVKRQTKPNAPSSGESVEMHGQSMQSQSMDVYKYFDQILNI